MPIKFSHIWQGAYEIPLFKWLYKPSLNKSENNMETETLNKTFHVYSMFMNRHARPIEMSIWHAECKRIFYSGEYIMDEEHADVVVRFMSSSDTDIPRYILNMETPQKPKIIHYNRVDTKYIQLRLQELDAIEWKINKLLSGGQLVLSAQNISSEHQVVDVFEQIRAYLLQPTNITPYADMVLSWYRNGTNTGTGSGSGNIKKRKFCLFMVSNPNCKLRNDTFMLLSRIGNVISAGGYNNNLTMNDKKPPERTDHVNYINYLRQFKFMITFENRSLPGYHTEKITNAFEAGVIPIYWGDPLITELYDARSFIHIPTLEDPNLQWDAVKYAITSVQKANNNSTIYNNYFKYPPISIGKQHIEDARVAASIRSIHDELQ